MKGSIWCCGSREETGISLSKGCKTQRTFGFANAHRVVLMGYAANPQQCFGSRHASSRRIFTASMILFLGSRTGFWRLQTLGVTHFCIYAS